MAKRFKFKEKDKDRIFFTSDTHFDHTNIIKYCNRPFSDIEDMNKNLILNWNSVVPEKDGIIFVLGDFAWKGFQQYHEVLNGSIYHLIGNHDSKPLKRISPDIIEISIGEIFIVCCHYPMRSWNKKTYGSYHFFGHVHDRHIDLPSHEKMYNVGVDVNSYKPISLLEIEESLNKRYILNGRIV